MLVHKISIALQTGKPETAAHGRKRADDPFPVMENDVFELKPVLVVEAHGD